MVHRPPTGALARRHGLIALVVRHLGDKDQLLDWWEKASEDRSFEAIFLKVDPANDELRNDPRFVALLRKANLGP